MFLQNLVRPNVSLKFIRAQHSGKYKVPHLDSEKTVPLGKPFGDVLFECVCNTFDLLRASGPVMCACTSVVTVCYLNTRIELVH